MMQVRLPHLAGGIKRGKAATDERASDPESTCSGNSPNDAGDSPPGHSRQNLGEISGLKALMCNVQVLVQT